MSILSIIFIAFALAMDAFAVSIASGVTIKKLKITHALTIGAWFGFFQGLMPLIGWLCGIKLRVFIEEVDHWVAFVLLCFVGGKMIYESFKLESVEEKRDPMDVYLLFVLSIATSIDALAAGLSFAMLDVSIITPVLLIGVITFFMSVLGVWIGNRCGHLFEKKIEVLGGVLLIIIGAKILLSHLMMGC
jgi:putative Mn2+ efflux pump MntP